MKLILVAVSIVLILVLAYLSCTSGSRGEAVNVLFSARQAAVLSAEEEDAEEKTAVNFHQDRMQSTMDFMRNGGAPDQVPGERASAEEEQEDPWSTPLFDKRVLSDKQRDEYDRSEKAQSALHYLPQATAAGMATTRPVMDVSPEMQATAGMLAQNFEVFDENADAADDERMQPVDGDQMAVALKLGPADFIDREAIKSKRAPGSRLDEYLRPEHTNVSFDAGAGQMMFNSTDAHDSARREVSAMMGSW